jgi:hypothetical protein
MGHHSIRAGSIARSNAIGHWYNATSNKPGDGEGRMNSVLRTPRAAAIAGVLFAILLTTALALVRFATPSDPSNPSAWLADQARNVWLWWR